MGIVAFGVFILLHGLVHLLYTGQSQRIFELQPGMIWPDRSWVFSRVLEVGVIRKLASVTTALAAAGFVAGGIGVLLRDSWHRPLQLVSAGLSSLAYMLFWDGQLERLSKKGVVGLLINLAIILLALFLNWPPF